MAQKCQYLWIGWSNLLKLLSAFQWYQVCEDWTSQSRDISIFVQASLKSKEILIYEASTQPFGHSL